MRSSIESLIKLPLEIPLETSVLSKEPNAKIPTNKSALKKEITEDINQISEETKKAEISDYSKGYIKYPAYDFF
jgi:hypothetical protein